MYPRSVIIALFLVLLSVFLYHCANPVTPVGGPKDITPPQVLECLPPNYSTLFSSPDIHITFDEFLALKSSGSEIFISPPLPEKPDFKLRGKTVVVDFADTLSPNTTYIISFGKSVSDITEGNVIDGFRYVFSTGTYIDSLMISGEVINAFDDKPVPNVYAELYSNSVDTLPFDSLPYLVLPSYITQTNEQGKFKFQNLKNDAYKLVVLDDKSGDFIYNMPSEKIAFADSLILPCRDRSPVPDSTSNDSVQPASDTLFPVSITLRMFEEIDSTQDIQRSELVMNNLFTIIFKYPPRNPLITRLYQDTLQEWCMTEYSSKMDTVLLFTTIEVPDTLVLEVRDGSSFLDTLTIAPTRGIKDKRGKKTEEGVPEQLTVVWKPVGILNYPKKLLTGVLSYPVSEYDFSGILLISGGDTLKPVVEFKDPLLRRFVVTTTWKEATSYKLLIPDSAFISYNGLSHDTVFHSFQTINPRDVGNLTISLDITGRPDTYVVQLISDKGTMVEEKTMNESGQIKFAFIAPGKYTIKAILDSNQNQRWDTGNYLKKIQPEEVFFFPKTVEIRGNWDVEEEWRL